MTVAALLQAQEALKALGDVAMPARTALRLARLRVSVDDALRPVSLAHDELLRKMSGGREQIGPGDKKFDLYLSERAKLGEQELEDMELPRISLELDTLGDVRPNVLTALVNLIDFE